MTIHSIPQSQTPLEDDMAPPSDPAQAVLFAISDSEKYASSKSLYDELGTLIGRYATDSKVFELSAIDMLLSTEHFGIGEDKMDHVYSFVKSCIEKAKPIVAAELSDFNHEMNVIDDDADVSPSGYVPLPDAVQVPDDIDLSNKWLDGYIEFSRQWSPRSYDAYHEAMGIWTLSAVAARRVYAFLGKRVYPSLYLILVSKSGQFSKTGAASISMGIIKDCALDFLLAPDQSTPAAFMLSMAGRLPVDYADLSPDRQERARRAMAFASARSWFYDEFGQHISAMMRENGSMADFRGYLKIIDDAPPTFRTATVARGEQVIKRPYLALSGAMTPADMAEHLGKGSTLWGDGFMARIATIAPAPGTRGSRAKYPKGAKVGQAKLVLDLQNWHEALGIPSVDIEKVVNDETGKVTYERQFHEQLDNQLSVSDDVYDAYYRYNNALLDMIDDLDGQVPDDLRAGYIRFHEKALRMSILLASIEGADRIELRHWFRAQTIAECWRSGLHNLYEDAVLGGGKSGRSVNEKILTKIRVKGPMTARSIQQAIWTLTNADDTRSHLTELCIDNELIQFRPDGKRSDYFRLPGQSVEV